MKINQKLTYLGAAAICASLLVSCSDDTDQVVIGSGEVQIGMGFQLAGSGSSNARIQNSGLNIESGFLQLKDLELETEGVDENGEFERELELEFPEIKKIEFNESDDDADFFINIPSGNYEEIEVEFDLIDHEDEPSIQLDGTYTYEDGSTVPFRLQVFGDDDEDLDFEVELEAEDDDTLFYIDEINNPLALLEIDGIGWFSGISTSELEDAELTDGVLLISRSVNEDIYEKVLDKIEDSSEIELELK